MILSELDYYEKFIDQLPDRIILELKRLKKNEEMRRFNRRKYEASIPQKVLEIGYADDRKIF